ncbi:hypothetical protein [Hymenobacter aerophilus]|uniref:hypothetical protein n=1 Tax=Hymenobacter aerophilus TaxID=119644 RepID=UPI00037A39A2|nr:hypothetical protein [Hymenobacter aerophilus]
MSSDSIPPDNRPQPAKVTPKKRPPKPSGRTVEEWISSFDRADGSQGVRVRELARSMGMAAETIKVARAKPELLSLASIFGLASELGITPDQLIADIFHQVSLRNELGLLKTKRR